MIYIRPEFENRLAQLDIKTKTRDKTATVFLTLVILAVTISLFALVSTIISLLSKSTSI